MLPLGGAGGALMLMLADLVPPPDDDDDDGCGAAVGRGGSSILKGSAVTAGAAGVASTPRDQLLGFNCAVSASAAYPVSARSQSSSMKAKLGGINAAGAVPAAVAAQSTVPKKGSCFTSLLFRLPRRSLWSCVSN